MAEIPLTRGYVAIVDDGDIPLVSRYRWRAILNACGKPYAAANVKVDGQYFTVLMHRMLAGAQDGQVVDHKDKDGLNNRRDNLRVCDQTHNAFNAEKRSNNTTGFKGVCRPKGRSRYRAQIVINGESRYLGSYQTAEEAARAYDKAANDHYPGFAHLNFPQEAAS